MRNKLIYFLDYSAVGLIMVGAITLIIPNFIEGEPWQPGTRNAAIFLFTGITLMFLTRVFRAFKKNE